MTHTLGIDISVWQDSNSTSQTPDFNKAKANGARFAFIRASQDVYPDPDFRVNWANAKAAGLPRGAYHMFDMRPGTQSAKNQAEYFCSLLTSDPGELPPVFDFERPNANYPELPPRARSLELINEFSEVVKSRTGRYPIIYTNWSTLQYTLQPIPDWLKGRGLWLAGYPYINAGETVVQAGERALKAGWYDSQRHFGWPWTFWQFSDRGNGPAFGMESQQIDLDFFRGDEADLHAYCGVTVAEPTDAEKLKILWEQYKRGGK